jgi:hypothetical protein
MWELCPDKGCCLVDCVSRLQIRTMSYIVDVGTAATYLKSRRAFGTSTWAPEGAMTMGLQFLNAISVMMSGRRYGDEYCGE